jgi:glycosyltransferase involved in cell wall biosynthesis
MLPDSISFDSTRLDQHFEFVGGIPADKIRNIYSKSDFLLNISDLESFSNNYMEAWKSGLPLVCSDTDFARNICGESAIYIDPHNAASSAAAIQTLMQDLSKQRQLADTGKERLTMLPNAQEKFDKIIAVLNEVAE